MSKGWKPNLITHQDTVEYVRKPLNRLFKSVISLALLQLSAQWKIWNNVSLIYLSCSEVPPLLALRTVVLNTKLQDLTGVSERVITRAQIEGITLHAKDTSHLTFLIAWDKFGHDNGACQDIVLYSFAKDNLLRTISFARPIWKSNQVIMLL